MLPLVAILTSCVISKLARLLVLRYDKAMSNTQTTEIPFLEAIASMTDAELAGYKARYAKAAGRRGLTLSGWIKAVLERASRR